MKAEGSLERGWIFMSENEPSILYFLLAFYNCIVPDSFLPLKIRVAFLGESQLLPNLRCMLGVFVFP